MGVSWIDDIDPIGVLGSRPGPALKPGPAHAHAPDPTRPLTGARHQRRRSGVLARPHAAAAAITTLLTRPSGASRRPYRRYWV
jgi:hypothetical protein